MNFNEAKYILLCHSGLVVDDNKNSFVRTLRPYSGLNPENFHEIMEAVFVLGEHLQSCFVDREIIVSLWGICDTVRRYGIDPTGMLCRNNLINADEKKILKVWVETITETILSFLSKHNITSAVRPYINYLNIYTFGVNIKNFISFFIKAIELFDPEDNDPRDIVVILGKMGRHAETAIPFLYSLLNYQNFTSLECLNEYSTDQEKKQFNEDVVNTILISINTIEKDIHNRKSSQ